MNENAKLPEVVDLPVSEYFDILKSNYPVPGGGSASCLIGVQGLCLLSMVCELTIGNPKYAEYEKLNKETLAEINTLIDKLKEGIQNDILAYSKLAFAYKMPKDTDEQKETRTKVITDATILATEAPFDNIKYAFSGLKLAQKLIGKSNKNASSDIGVGALNLLASIKGNWLNVKINLKGIKDEMLYEKFISAKDIIIEAEVISKAIYDEIEKVL